MSKEAIKLALEALKEYAFKGVVMGKDWQGYKDIIKALEEALAKQEPHCMGTNCRMPDADNHSPECILETAESQGWSDAPEAIEARKVIAEEEKQEQDEPCCYGGVAHDCHAGEDCRIVKRFKAKQLKQEQGEPVLEIVNGQINRSWDAIPENFNGLLYMQSQPSVPSKKPQEPWYGSARVDDYNRGWNDCVDVINAAHQPLHAPQTVAIYMGHRLTPEGTKEFWGLADSPLPIGTKLYATSQQRTWAGLTDERRIELAIFNGLGQATVSATLGLSKAIEEELKEKNG
jgi:hypothetical protein